MQDGHLIAYFSEKLNGGVLYFPYMIRSCMHW